MSATDTLWLWIDGAEAPCATLRFDDALGEYQLRYLLGAREALSLTLPLGEDCDTLILPPALAQNLPEGFLRHYLENQLNKQQARTLYERSAPDLELLALIGEHQIGRVRASASEHTPPAGSFEQSEDLGTLLGTQEDNESLLAQCLERFALRSGVSGAQPKVLADDDTRLTLPMNRYLVKFATKGFHAIAANEHYCLLAARLAGLQTPQTWLSEDGQRLVIERFDVADNPTRALAFEEAASLAWLSAHGKYNGSYQQLAKTLLGAVSPGERQAARRDLFASIALSMTLENGDAHQKNFGVCYEPGRPVRLAPVYDVVSTTAYLPSDRPALAFEHISEHDGKSWPDGAQLLAFGQQIGLPRAQALQTLAEVRRGVLQARERLIIEQGEAQGALVDKLTTLWGRGLSRLEQGLNASQRARLHQGNASTGEMSGECPIQTKSP